MVIDQNLRYNLCMFSFLLGKLELCYMETFDTVMFKYEKGYMLIFVSQSCGH